MLELANVCVREESLIRLGVPVGVEKPTLDPFGVLVLYRLPVVSSSPRLQQPAASPSIPFALSMVADVIAAFVLATVILSGVHLLVHGYRSRRRQSPSLMEKALEKLSSCLLLTGSLMLLLTIARDESFAENYHPGQKLVYPIAVIYNHHWMEHLLEAFSTFNNISAVDDMMNNRTYKAKWWHALRQNSLAQGEVQLISEYFICINAPSNSSNYNKLVRVWTPSTMDHSLNQLGEFAISVQLTTQQLNQTDLDEIGGGGLFFDKDGLFEQSLTMDPHFVLHYTTRTGQGGFDDSEHFYVGHQTRQEGNQLAVGVDNSTYRFYFNGELIAKKPRTTAGDAFGFISRSHLQTCFWEPQVHRRLSAWEKLTHGLNRFLRRIVEGQTSTSS